MQTVIHKKMPGLLCGLAIGLTACFLGIGSALLTPNAALAQLKKAAQEPSISIDEQAAHLRDAALSSNISYGWLTELTTRFGPRPAGTLSETKAADWAAANLKSAGFDKVWIDKFPLYVWERGVEKIEVMSPYPQQFVVAALGGSQSSPPEGIVAESVIFDTYAAFIDSKADVSGKIVVVLQPTARTQNGVGYGVNSSSVRSQGPLEAKKRGAVGYVMRSLGTEDQRFAHAGATRYQEGEGLPSLAISPPDAEALARMEAMRLKEKKPPIRLKILSRPSFHGEKVSQNVIAEWVGSEFPDQIITIGGHMDSWDLGTGAIDDGAGMAITIAAVKTMIDRGMRPKRTIRVVLYGAEEVSQPGGLGLSGARDYATRHVIDISKHIITAESDFGADLIYAAAMPIPSKQDFNRRLGKILGPIGVYVEPAANLSGGPDTGPTVAKGVPAMNLRQNGFDYFDTHHTADDVLERIDPQKMTQNVAVWTATLWMIANDDVRFSQPSAPPAVPPLPLVTQAQPANRP
jgi:hypothetical protein